MTEAALATPGSTVTVKPAGPGAWLIRVPGDISTAAFHRVLALQEALVRRALAWVGEIVPAYNALLVFTQPEAPADAGAVLLQIAAAAPALPAPLSAEHRTAHQIPVFYDASVAPDLDALADAKGLPPAELVEQHARATYEVHAIGFRPGFPFLAGLDPALATPRRATPRLSVAAGSVAIGGAQTGIYPVEGPGGWHVIGRTPLRLFDATRARPSLLAVGDTVHFVAIDRARFEELGGSR